MKISKADSNRYCYECSKVASDGHYIKLDGFPYVVSICKDCTNKLLKELSTDIKINK